jgi:hypothetical protein
MNAHIVVLRTLTAHPEDSQVWPKHVGATNWENICAFYWFSLVTGFSYFWIPSYVK